MIALLFALAATAPVPSDFAWTAEVPTPASGGLEWVDWTDSVYRLSRREDHGDVALFSGEGKLLPWAEPTIRGRLFRRAEIPLERLPAPRRRRDPGSKPDTSSLPDRWLAQLPDSLRGLWPEGARLELRSDGGAPFLGDVVLETSADLADWTRAGGGGICQVGTGKDAILRDSVSLQGPLARYLRVSVVSNAPVGLRGLELSLGRDSLLAAPMPRGAVEVQAHSTPGSWDYDLGADFPVDRIDLDVGAQSILDARIFAHASDDTDWIEIGRSSFYEVEFQGHRLRTPPLELSGRPFRHWRVVPVSTTLSRPPGLRAEWTRRRRLFLCGPGQRVVLAVGSRRLEVPDPGLSEDLFSGFATGSGRNPSSLAVVAPSGFRRSGTGIPDPVTDSGRWVLAALVAAALSTLWFAWKVWKESTSRGSTP